MENKSYFRKIENFQINNFPKQYKAVEYYTAKVMPTPKLTKYVAPAVLPCMVLVTAIVGLSVLVFAATRKEREFKMRMYTYGGFEENIPRRNTQGQLTGEQRLVKRYPEWKCKKGYFYFKQHQLNTSFGRAKYEDLIFDVKRLKGITLTAEEPKGGWHVFKILETQDQVDID